MNLTIDTQSIIWFAENDPKLSKTVNEAIESTKNNCYVSIASFWEISIKINIGKLEIKGLTLEAFMDLVETFGFDILNISKEHILEYSKLPLHHRDPFDRLIITQAMVEECSIVSSDRAFGLYEPKVVW